MCCLVSVTIMGYFSNTCACYPFCNGDFSLSILLKLSEDTLLLEDKRSVTFCVLIKVLINVICFFVPLAQNYVPNIQVNDGREIK